MSNTHTKIRVACVVPARLDSTRLPGKALADIMGLPMVVHTCKRAKLAKNVDAVYLATDNEEIRKAGEVNGITVIMTGSHNRNATERAAEAAAQIDTDIVIVLQGDEPLVYPEHIDAIAQALIDDPSLQIAIGATPFTKRNSVSDIKAVLDLAGNVMYCSRNDIPGSNGKKGVKEMIKLCFIVPFRKSFLQKYMTLKQTPLDDIEDNHFLRILEHGIPIRAVMVQGAQISVDTQEDLDEVIKLMKEDKLRLTYM
jgi:3-deoxy-manno-octulosonate cytidylyltransferase (CMP-KDO synthetase)